MNALLLTIGISLLAWLWSNNMRARERALELAKKACQSVSSQFLDQTVSINRFGFGREPNGRLSLQRVYGFEFTVSGEQRYEGRIAMQGMRVKAVHLDHPEGPIVIEPNQLH